MDKDTDEGNVDDKMSVAGKILKYWVLDGKKVADWLSRVFSVSL